MDQKYIEILHLFGDSEACSFSIHNLLEAGKAYGLAAGSWVGPYAVCHAWENLVRSMRNSPKDCLFPMAIYVVSGDEDGQRGGAPVVCIEDASKCCHEFSHGQLDWTPILLLVPLVLGLDKVTPRFVYFNFYPLESPVLVKSLRTISIIYFITDLDIFLVN